MEVGVWICMGVLLYTLGVWAVRIRAEEDEAATMQPPSPVPTRTLPSHSEAGGE